MKKIVLPDYIQEVLDVFRKNGYPCFVVGGAIRDFFLGIEIDDYDLTTSANYEEIMSLFKNNHFINKNGNKHGTYTLRYKNNNIEISTFKYSENEEPTLENDVRHRDLNINSIAFDGKDYYDYRNGFSDLNNRLVSMGSGSEEIIEEDPCRLLRALRFAATLNFDIDENTKLAIKRNIDKLSRISKERIINEVSKILMSDKVEQLLFDYSDVFTFIFPDLKPCLNFDQNTRWHAHDLYTHIVHVVRNTPKDLNLRYAALFHDLGKVKTVSQEYIEGVGYINHYYNHPRVSEQLAKPILDEYKFSNYDKSEILFLIHHHDYTLTPTRKCVRKLLAKCEVINSNNPLIVFTKLIDIELADKVDHTKLTFTKEDKDKLIAIAKELLDARDGISKKDLPINGTIIKKMGYEKEQIGIILDDVFNLILEEKLPNDKEAIINYIKSNY